MTSNEILKADILDILFDNRNKQYGAYSLRKNYNGRLGAALGLSLGVALLFFLVLKLYHPNRGGGFVTDKGTVTVIDLILPPAPKKQEVIPPKKQPVLQIKTEKLTTIDIKPDDKVKDIVPDQSSLSISAISNVKMDGEVPGDIAVVNKQVTAVVEKQPEVVAAAVAVSREPEFPGGQQAWINFLQKYLIPPGELEPGDTKKVSIRFHVSVEGEVTDFEVVLSAGKTYDNEVIRVLKKMPRWKPAIQNGQPVAKAFTQPVTFVGIEQ